MHKRNQLHVAIGLVYDLLDGLLALVRLIASTPMRGNAPGNPIVMAARDGGGYRQ